MARFLRARGGPPRRIVASPAPPAKPRPAGGASGRRQPALEVVGQVQGVGTLVAGAVQPAIGEVRRPRPRPGAEGRDGPTQALQRRGRVLGGVVRALAGDGRGQVVRHAALEAEQREHQRADAGAEPGRAWLREAGHREDDALGAVVQRPRQRAGLVRRGLQRQAWQGRQHVVKAAPARCRGGAHAPPASGAPAWGLRRTGPAASVMAAWTSGRRPSRKPASAATNSGPMIRPTRSSTKAGLRPSHQWPMNWITQPTTNRPTPVPAQAVVPQAAAWAPKATPAASKPPITRP